MLNAAMTTSIMKSVATGVTILHIVTILHSSALQMMKQKSYVIAFSCIKQRQNIKYLAFSLPSFKEQKSQNINV